MNIWSAFLRNDGAPSLAAVAVIAGGCLNAIGDCLLIFQMNMGIRGAGIATAAGLYLSNIIMLFHFQGKGNTLRLVSVKWSRLREIAASGFPSTISDLSLGIFSDPSLP